MLAGPLPDLSLLLEQDPSAPAYTLGALLPGPLGPPELAEAALPEVFQPPQDILPRPSWLAEASLTPPEQPCRPDGQPAAMSLPGRLNNMGTARHYWKHQVSPSAQPASNCPRAYCVETALPASAAADGGYFHVLSSI